VQIISASTQLLAMRVLLPPALIAGTLRLSFTPRTAPVGFEASDFTVTATFEVPPIEPKILAAMPSSAQSSGGDTIRLELIGFPGITRSDLPQVSISNSLESLDNTVP
jgi:hypothetical protein